MQEVKVPQALVEEAMRIFTSFQGAVLGAPEQPAGRPHRVAMLGAVLGLGVLAAELACSAKPDAVADGGGR